MEELTTKINNAIESAAGFPVIKRDATGKLDFESLAIGVNEKGNYIFPDEIIEKYYRELPNGSTNANNNKWVYNGGILNKATPEVQKQGGEALQAKLRQRRTIQETIQIMLAQKATEEEKELYNLPEGATKQDAMTAAMLAKAIDRGDVQAGIFIRDTAGEKPTDKLEAAVITTPEDIELINRVASRLPE